MLEVLVARMAPGFELRLELRVQRPLGVEILEDGFDDDIGIGGTVAIDVHPQARKRRGGRRRILEALVEESSWRDPRPVRINSAERSCSVTVMPRKADHAAISPPMTPAPMTCTCRKSTGDLPPKPFSRSCSMNTRTRLRDVGVHMSSLIDRASAS